LRLESGAAGPSTKPADRTTIIPQGVKFGEPDRNPPPPGPETTVFQKKSTAQNRWFWIGVGLAALVVAVFLVYALLQLNR
jgi:hypothetical protein